MPPLSDEWRAEMNRRSAEFDAGLVQPIPWEQVRSESLQRFARCFNSMTGMISSQRGTDGAGFLYSIWIFTPNDS